MPSIWSYALIGGIAAVCTFVATYPVKAIAKRIGFVDEPDERRIHTRTTPNGGGVAMFVAFLVAMIVASQLSSMHDLFQSSSEPLGVVLAGTVIVAVGLIDDWRDMSAPAKMAGQVLAAMILVFLGVTMFWFKLPFAGLIVLSSSLIPLLTALWVIVMTNAVNFIDGLDGLCAGVIAIASGAIAVYGLHLMQTGVLEPDNVGPLIAIIACGMCIGFLPHNFSPAKIFMGDAGALFLGLLMAAATMVIGGRTTDVTGQTYFFFAPLLIPVVILGVPIVDMSFAFVRRTAKRVQFHSPDKDHIHHRLLRLGHGPRRTVVILWAWTGLLSGFVLVPLYFPRGNSFIPLGAAVIVLTLYTWFHPGLRKNDLAIDETNGESDADANGEADALGRGVLVQQALHDDAAVTVQRRGVVVAAESGDVVVAAQHAASEVAAQHGGSNGFDDWRELILPKSPDKSGADKSGADRNGPERNGADRNGPERKSPQKKSPTAPQDEFGGLVGGRADGGD